MGKITEFLKRSLGSETNIEDLAAGVGQDDSTRPHSLIYRVYRSIVNKCSAFGSSLGVASETTTFSPVSELPMVSLHSSNPPRDELSTPSGNISSDSESISRNQEDDGLPHRQAGMEFRYHTGPLGPGTLHVNTNPGNPSCLRFRVHGMRLNVSPQDQLDSSNTLDNYDVFDIDLEIGAHNGNRPSRVVDPLKLGKIFLGVTYQALSSFLIFHFQAAGSTSSQDYSLKPPHLLLQIVEVNLAVSFAATLIGILLRQAYPDMSVVIERAGSMSAAFGFFVMVSLLLTSISEWVGWICAVGSLLAFVIEFIKSKND